MARNQKSTPKQLYHWLYIPDGKTGISEYPGTYQELLQDLDIWNRSSENWKYWSV